MTRDEAMVILKLSGQPGEADIWKAWGAIKYSQAPLAPTDDATRARREEELGLATVARDLLLEVRGLPATTGATPSPPAITSTATPSSSPPSRKGIEGIEARPRGWKPLGSTPWTSRRPHRAKWEDSPLWTIGFYLTRYTPIGVPYFLIVVAIGAVRFVCCGKRPESWTDMSRGQTLAIGPLCFAIGAGVGVVVATVAWAVLPASRHAGGNAIGIGFFAGAAACLVAIWRLGPKGNL